MNGRLVNGRFSKRAISERVIGELIDQMQFDWSNTDENIRCVLLKQV